MNRRHATIGVRPGALALVLAAALALPACPSDPYDVQTWIDKLDDDDPEQVKQALTWIERLKDPKAIKPLGKVWETQGRPQKVMKIMIELADQKDDKGGPYWEDALDVLIRAVEEFDVGDQRSIENAVIAADALGNAADDRGIDPLIRAVNKSMPKLSSGQRVRLSAIAALGKFRNNTRAVDTLLKVLGADPEQQPLALFGAAANALADARSEKAIIPLLETAFKLSPIYNQCRLALIAIGKPVIPELIKVFKGEHKEINAIAKQYKFNIGCDREYGPDTKCQAPSNLQFKAASLLGDMYAKDAAKLLADGLKQTPLPAYFQQGAPGPPQHNAILDSLRKIADPSVGGAVKAYWTNKDTEDYIRPVAIDVYSYLTNDTSSLGDLAKLILDEDQDAQVRLGAGFTYGRLVTSPSQFKPLTDTIEKSRGKADDYLKKVKAAEKAVKAAEKAYNAALERSNKAKNNKKLAEAAAKAKSALEGKRAEKSEAESWESAHRELQRTFEQHLVRAQTGITCKKDPACYIGILDKEPDAIGKDVAKYIRDLKEWSPADKTNLKVAAVERAMIELIKMKEKARPVFDRVLKHAESTDRITRQGLLLVMVHSAPLPCDQCVTRLDEIIAEQGEQSTLAALTGETKAVRNYFLWAGK